MKITITIEDDREGVPYEPYQRCMFDGLPPGVYGIACPCPRHSVWC